MKLIYLVEDDEDIQESMTAVLLASGYRVEVTDSPEEALRRLRSGFRPAVVLLDLMFPTMDGMTVYEALRKERTLAEVPVCLITAAHPHECPRGCPILPKPFELSALLSLVEGLSCT